MSTRQTCQKQGICVRLESAIFPLFWPIFEAPVHPPLTGLAHDGRLLFGQGFAVEIRPPDIPGDGHRPDIEFGLIAHSSHRPAASGLVPYADPGPVFDIRPDDVRRQPLAIQPTDPKAVGCAFYSRRAIGKQRMSKAASTVLYIEIAYTCPFKQRFAIKSGHSLESSISFVQHLKKILRNQLSLTNSDAKTG